MIAMLIAIIFGSIFYLKPKLTTTKSKYKVS